MLLFNFMMFLLGEFALSPFFSKYHVGYRLCLVFFHTYDCWVTVADIHLSSHSKLFPLAE